MPELPEEVEAVVCDVGDLAEGETKMISPHCRWQHFMSGCVCCKPKLIPGEMRQVDVGGHPVLLCRDQGDLKVKTRTNCKFTTQNVPKGVYVTLG